MHLNAQVSEKVENSVDVDKKGCPHPPIDGLVNQQNNRTDCFLFCWLIGKGCKQGMHNGRGPFVKGPPPPPCHYRYGLRSQTHII